MAVRLAGQIRPRTEMKLCADRHEIDCGMFTASVNFEIEFQPIAFIEHLQAGPFNRTDMHECIRLAIISGDEAKTLCAIEELDGSSRLFAGQLALRRGWAGLHRNHVAHNLQIGSGHLAATINEVEFQLLTFSERFQAGTFHSADVDEHIGPAIIPLDKTESFLSVEELHNALAGSDYLSRHATEAAAASTSSAGCAAAATRTATCAAAEPAAATATTEPVIIVKTARPTESVVSTELIAAYKGIEAFFTEPIAFVASPTATPSIKTHNAERTFVSPTHYSRQRGRIVPGPSGHTAILNRLAHCSSNCQHNL
jgi:hypothetical protein